MELVLQHIGMVPGVIGCFMCNEDGQPMARSIPATFDQPTLKRTTEILTEIAAGIQKQPAGAKLVDLSYDIGRIIVKQIPEGFLAVLCTPSINVQLLAISLNVAQNRIHNLIHNTQPQPAIQSPVPQTLAPSVQQIVTPVAESRLRTDGKGVVLSVDSMNVSAKIKWDQMEENSAISSKLALDIQRMLSTGPFKKIKLFNKAAECSKTFSVITFERSSDQLSDDRIVLTLAAAEALQAKPGDEITLEPITGGGFFSWN